MTVGLLPIEFRAVRKDDPGSGDAHVDGVMGSGKKRKKGRRFFTTPKYPGVKIPSYGIDNTTATSKARDVSGEARDEIGEWTSGGGSGGAASTPRSATSTGPTTPTLPQITPPITEAEARGNSRPVTAAEFEQLVAKGRDLLSKYRSSPPTGLDNNFAAITDQAYQAVQESWGGVTVDAHTGQAIEPKTGYALTVKNPGQDSVSVPLNATRDQFAAAMAEARNRFGTQLTRSNHNLGVFRDDDTSRIDIDPVLVVKTTDEVEAIGAATHAVGGAYDFSTGNGFFPPHVADPTKVKTIPVAKFRKADQDKVGTTIAQFFAQSRDPNRPMFDDQTPTKAGTEAKPATIPVKFQQPLGKAQSHNPDPKRKPRTPDGRWTSGLGAHGLGRYGLVLTDDEDEAVEHADPHVTLIPILRKDFDPNEPRGQPNNAGEWTSGAGGAGAAKAPGFHEPLAPAGKDGKPAPAPITGLGLTEFPPEFVSRMNKKAASMGISVESVLAQYEDKFAKADSKDGGWYHKAHDEAQRIADETGLDSSVTAGVLANIAALREWGKNVRDAEAICQVVSANKPFEVTQAQADEWNERRKGKNSDRIVLTPGQYSPKTCDPLITALYNPDLMKAKVIAATGTPPIVQAILMASDRAHVGDIIKGPKLRSFYNNIAFPDDDRFGTVDTWMYRAGVDPKQKFKTTWNGKPGEYTLDEFTTPYGPSKKKQSKGPQDLFQSSPGGITQNKVKTFPDNIGLYPIFRAALNQGAKLHGMKTNEYQAIIWQHMLDQTGGKAYIE